MGFLGQLLQKCSPGAHEPDEFVFTVKTEKGVSRDDRTIRRYFLTPVAKALEFYSPGFGFHSFRREAVTEIAHESDPYQAMRAAGHSKMDTSLLYGLADEERQDEAIRRIQERVLRPTGLLNGTENQPLTAGLAHENGPQKAKVISAGVDDEFATAFVFNLVDGGPAQTRTGDLYRVEVALRHDQPGRHRQDRQPRVEVGS